MDSISRGRSSCVQMGMPSKPRSTDKLALHFSNRLIAVIRSESSIVERYSASAFASVRRADAFNLFSPARAQLTAKPAVTKSRKLLPSTMTPPVRTLANARLIPSSTWSSSTITQCTFTAPASQKRPVSFPDS